MTNTIKIAFHSPTKRFMHIDNAENGLSCNCECYKCNERLEAIQGKIRTNHFRHHTNVNCKGSQETALHEFGKQILIENSQIAIPEHGTISYSDPEEEKQFERIRPDVSAIYNGQQIFFEILVTHPVGRDKESFFIYGKHRSVEINLSGALNSTYEEIENIVLHETSKKRLIYWEKKEPVKAKINEQKIKQDNSSLIEQLLKFFVVIVFIGHVVYSIFRKQNYQERKGIRSKKKRTFYR